MKDGIAMVGGCHIARICTRTRAAPPPQIERAQVVLRRVRGRATAVAAAAAAAANGDAAALHVVPALCSSPENKIM